MADPVSVTTRIEASPEVVYDLVSDLPRMGELSPENTGGKWLGGATGPTVGARFKGTNRNGIRRWSTVCTVVDATPGEVFSFDVKAGPWTVARWTYRITPSGAGCDVTETWEDRRAGWMNTVGGLASGVKDRATHNEAGMRATLERLKAAAEVHAG
ncbi:MAG: SRPBCC family protein [Acidimicrobiia bacterium]